MVYYNNNGEIYAFNSHDEYNRWISMGNDEIASVSKEEADEILAATAAAQLAAAEAALTIPERIYRMEGLAASILDLECKNEKYFHNTGFTHGIKSIRRFPNHPDTIKLLAWEKSMWEQVESWVKAIDDGPVDPIAFTTMFIAENLPKIEDF